MLLIYLIYIATMSMVAFYMYFKDKMNARKGLVRIPERFLLGIGVVGGATGSLVAMLKYRHKTRHIYFYIVNILGIVLHVAIACAIVIDYFI